MFSWFKKLKEWVDGCVVDFDDTEYCEDKNIRYFNVYLDERDGEKIGGLQYRTMAEADGARLRSKHPFKFIETRSTRV